MKIIKKLKEGFTLVELVVVIAIIAILSGVSVAAYVGISESAKESAAMQEARSAYNNWYAEELLKPNGQTKPNIDILSDGYWFHVDNGEFKTDGIKGDSGNRAVEDGKYEDYDLLTTDGNLTLTLHSQTE